MFRCGHISKILAKFCRKKRWSIVNSVVMYEAHTFKTSIVLMVKAAIPGDQLEPDAKSAWGNLLL